MLSGDLRLIKKLMIMEQEYKQQYDEFCEIFKGLNVSQAIDKAKELGLDYKQDYDLVELNQLVG